MRIERLELTNNNYNSKIYNPNFKRNWAEHASWGANLIKEQGKANFKLFSFPDAKAVFVEVGKKASSKFGSIIDRIAKIIFAQGAALSISALNSEDGETKIHKMEHKGEGIYEASNIDAEEGSQYRFIVVNKDNNISLVKDPYSKQQPDINGWSEIYNPDNYEWKNTAWLSGKDPRRIVRQPNEKLRGLGGLIIEEVNIPTLSEDGTFDKAKEYIDKIALKGVANAIEIMPVENTFSLQWGYDGVDKFAVNPKMGSQAQFKELIDYAHGKGLNVIIDAVPNHIGPDGNYLPITGPYKKNVSDFGDVPNYEGPNNKYVRDWITNAMLWWANEFKADGLRLDMTKYCASDYLLKQIVEEVNYHNPSVFLIAEDGRDNKYSTTAYNTHQNSHDEALAMIDENVNNIAYRNWSTYPTELGYDSEWDFPLMHELKDVITKSKDLDLNKLDHLIRNSNHRVKFVMSHDEIGNMDGTRLIPKILCKELNLFQKVDGRDDAERGQKAAYLSQKIAELYVNKNIESMSLEDLHKYAKEHGLGNNKHISPQAINNAFDIAKAKHKLGLATIFTIPGPKMFFQGDDEMNLSRFKFFREFSSDSWDRANKEGYIDWIKSNKGYDWHEPIARKDSLINSVPQNNRQYSEQMKLFSTDLSDIVKGSEVFSKGDIVATYKDTKQHVHIHHLKYNNEEVLVIKNFGNSFNDSYGYEAFPNGNWKEIFNSDSVSYGGSDYINSQRGNSIDRRNQHLNIAPNSVIILKKS